MWHFDKAWQRQKRGKERGREVVGGSSGREEEGPSQALEGAGLCSMFALTGSPEPTQREARWSR